MTQPDIITLIDAELRQIQQQLDTLNARKVALEMEKAQIEG